MPKLIGDMHIPPLISRRPKRPTWKNTFNSSLLRNRNWKRIVDAARAARYPFFITVPDGYVCVTPKFGYWSRCIGSIDVLRATPLRHKK